VGKADEFSRVLDLLHDEGKDKLLISAQGLIKAQGVIKVCLPKGKKTQQREKLCVKKQAPISKNPTRCMKKDTFCREIEGR